MSDYVNASPTRIDRWRVFIALVATAGLLFTSCSAAENDDGAAAAGERGDAVDAATDNTAADNGTTDTAADAAGTDPAGALADDGSPPADDGVFIVGAVMPTARDDRGFSQSLVDSLNRLAESGRIDEIRIHDNVVLDEDADVILKELAADNVDLIIGHGPQYGGLVAQMATERADLAFAWGYGEQTFGLTNLSAYNVNAGQGGYVLGQVAAHLLGAGSVALIGPSQIGDDKAYIEGFFTGIAATGLEMDVSLHYIESYVDVDVASERARESVGNEADVLASTSPISAGVIAVAQESGIPYFGNQVDSSDLAPNTVVASQVYRWEVVLDPLITSIGTGIRGGDTLLLDLANDGLTIDYNPAYGLADDVRAVGDAAEAEAEAGGFDLTLGG